jgi:hypothetical protein
VIVGHVANDGETEAGAAGIATASTVNSIEPLEDPIEVAPRDPNALVGDHHLDRCIVDAHSHLHGATTMAVLDGILDQVPDCRLELTFVATQSQPVWDIE